MNPIVLIWCCIDVLFTAVCVFAWFLRQMWIGYASISRALDSVASELVSFRRDVEIVSGSIAHVSDRVKTVEAWAASWVALQESIVKQQDEKIEDINKRLIVAIETENKNTPPVKREDEDPFTGSRSWTAQAAAASRGLGVEDFA